jgi:hypothetical protein
VGVQTSSTSPLLRWKWKSGKTTATGTRNSAFLLAPYRRGRHGRVREEPGEGSETFLTLRGKQAKVDRL